MNKTVGVSNHHLQLPVLRCRHSRFDNMTCTWLELFQSPRSRRKDQRVRTITVTVKESCVSLTDSTNFHSNWVFHSSSILHAVLTSFSLLSMIFFFFFRSSVEFTPTWLCPYERKWSLIQYKGRLHRIFDVQCKKLTNKSDLYSESLTDCRQVNVLSTYWHEEFESTSMVSGSQKRF